MIFRTLVKSKSNLITLPFFPIFTVSIYSWLPLEPHNNKRWPTFWVSCDNNLTYFLHSNKVSMESKLLYFKKIMQKMFLNENHGYMFMLTKHFLISLYPYDTVWLLFDLLLPKIQKINKGYNPTEIIILLFAIMNSNLKGLCWKSSSMQTTIIECDLNLTYFMQNGA